MSPTHLFLNKKSYTYDQIRSKEYTASSEFEETTLAFCSHWLNGHELFEQKTSGSTGKPKVITITRWQMKLSASYTMKALNLSQNDIALVCLDPAYIAGKMMLVRAFENNLKIVIVKPTSNPLETLDFPFHFVAMVPMQIENVLQNEASKNQLSECKAILIGGAPVSRTLEKKIAQLNCPVFATYGMTETVSHIALKRISSPKEDYFTTIGDVKIQTNHNKQLVIKGAITDEKELITNDTVHLLSTKTFEWIGRIDNTINSGGVKIQLEEVEKSIDLIFNKLKLKKRFFLYKKSEAYLGDKLVLFIESSSNDLDRKLKIILKQKLSKYSLPKEIIYRNRFIETASGKINKMSTANQIN